jgi:GAF domain-containing protein
VSDPIQTVDRATWQQLIGLSERLMASEQVATQCELIVETATQVTKGQAEIWLSEAFWRLPTSDVSTVLSTRPPSDLMRRALDTRQIYSYPDTTPAVAIPLRARDKVIGILQVKRPDGPPFGDKETRLLGCLATQSAVALQSTHQMAVEHWREKQLSLVSKVSAQIANVLDVQELAHRVTDLILHTFKYYYVALFTLAPRGQVLRCQASAGPLDRPVNDPESLPLPEIQLGQGIIGHVAQTGVAIVANDVSREPLYRPVDILPKTRSEVALPLKIEDRVLGVLDVQRDRPEDLHAVDLLVLQSLAENITIALEHARLYSNLRRRAEQISAIAEVSRAVASFLDLDDLLDEVITVIERQFGYPSAHLFTVDLTRRRTIYRAGSLLYDTSLDADELSFSLDTHKDIIPWVIHHGEMALANDTSQDLRCRPSPLRPPSVHAELVVPLVSNDEVIGVLDVQSERRNAFDADDSFLFQALADSVAIAIRNANLYRSERWRRQVADSMREVAGLLSSDMVLEELLDIILFELERTLLCDLAAILLLDDDDLCVTAIRGGQAKAGITGFPSDANSWLTQALEADQPVIRPTECPLDPLATDQSFPPDYSAIAAPLRAGGQTLGLLILAHRTAGRYGAESQLIMAAFASYAAVAIENARVYQASQEQALISSVMLQVAEATQSLTTLDEVLETIVRLAPMLVGINRCAILLLDESETTFVPAAAYGLDLTQQVTFEQWRIEMHNATPFDELLLTKAPLVVHNVATDTRISRTLFSTLGFESLLALPLLAQGQVLGAILVDYRDDEFGFDTAETLQDERLAVIQGITHQAAAVIENTQLREAQQEDAYISAALLQVAQTVANLNDLDDILSAIIRMTPILVGIEHCLLFLWDDELSVFRPSHTYGLLNDAEVILSSQLYAPGDFALLDAMRDHGPVFRSYDTPSDLLDDIDGLFPRDFVALLGYTHERQEARSLMAFPLAVRGELFGAMILEETKTHKRSHRKRLDIMTGIAQQAALAVQNDRLEQERVGRERLERELQLAREIQQTFIPSHLTEPPGWELAALWQAARQVAGDFYDLLELPDEKLGILIADVADKGMPAALFMVLTRALVRAAALDQASPAAALAQVNDLLVPDARQGMFVTVFYAVLSPASGELIYANAGHNPPLLLQSHTQEIERLEKGGMALGVLPGNRIKERQVILQGGDCVVFYTDGLTDALSPQGDLYGEKKLLAAIRAAPRDSAQALLEALDRAVHEHIGTAPPADDLTLIVLCRAQDEPGS